MTYENKCQMRGCDKRADLHAPMGMMRQFLPNLLPEGWMYICGTHYDQVVTDRSSLYDADRAAGEEGLLS